MGMNHYLMDTNHAGALLRGDLSVIKRISSLQDATLSLCVPCIGELWFMVYNSSRVEENRTRLAKLIAQFRIAHFNTRAAREFGRIRADLRRKGQPIPAIDVQIAAIARINDLIVLTSDRHFQFVPD